MFTTQDTVHTVNTYAAYERCYRNTKPIGVWFCNIAPTFYIVFGESCECDAIEAAYDMHECGGTFSLADADSAHMAECYDEFINAGMSEEEAYEAAYEGAFALNGGAAYLDMNSYGFFRPTDEQIQQARLMASIVEVHNA